VDFLHDSHQEPDALKNTPPTGLIRSQLNQLSGPFGLSDGGSQIHRRSAATSFDSSLGRLQLFGQRIDLSQCIRASVRFFLHDKFLSEETLPNLRREEVRPVDLVLKTTPSLPAMPSLSHDGVRDRNPGDVAAGDMGPAGTSHLWEAAAANCDPSTSPSDDGGAGQLAANGCKPKPNANRDPVRCPPFGLRTSIISG
jgi:hypothetical protein